MITATVLGAIATLGAAVRRNRRAKPALVPVRSRNK